MSQDKYMSILAYRQTRCIFEKMVRDGTITKKDFADIDGIIAKKYGLSLSVIYR